ncbi:MAG: hypothetical protein EOO52_19735 [Gammaproteobacteria bacterium]|nr:MAG: hypothetical protein EOO52_19735 [Gammaproteobacteria bacterium]
MISECPKCHYRRQPIDVHINADICPACGIAYEKWLTRQAASNESNNHATPTPSLNEEERRQTFREFISYVPENIDPATFWARAATLGCFALWGFYFISAGVDWEKIGGSFLHGPNLAFHEFGHIFFSPFGRFITILGGSLFQILLPLGLMAVFMIKQRDNFAASIMLWWSGQNFIDVAPYIDDAKYRALPLVGGGGEESHDWGNLLTMMNALESTHTISHGCFYIGCALVVAALLWGFQILRLQKKNLAPH